MPDDNEKYEYSWKKFVKFCKSEGIGEWKGEEFDNWDDIEIWWKTWTNAIAADRNSK